MCAAAGLTVLEVAPIGGLPEILIDITSKSALDIFRRLPFLGRGLAALFQSTGSWVLNLRIGKKASVRTADRYPLGYALVAAKQRPVR
jgi:hypothetical protein